ncbi:MAG: inner membrane protein YpjD, partial [Lysobacter sp.]|nr:inner membrane protein YpjD [Lysobacter sp.]
MTIVLISAAAYLMAAALLVEGVRRNDEAGRSRNWLAPAIVAAVLHASMHLLASRGSGGADLHFFAALSLVGLGMALLTT